jgi:hypothetical protein
MAACAQYSQATFNNTRARADHVTTCVEISTSNNSARAPMGMLSDLCCVEMEACGIPRPNKRGMIGSTAERPAIHASIQEFTGLQSCTFSPPNLYHGASSTVDEKVDTKVSRIVLRAHAERLQRLVAHVL